MSQVRGKGESIWTITDPKETTKTFFDSSNHEQRPKTAAQKSFRRATNLLKESARPQSQTNYLTTVVPSYTNANKVESDVTSLTFTDYQNQVLNGKPPTFQRRSKSVSNTALARRKRYSTTGPAKNSHRSISEINGKQDQAITAAK